MVKVVVVKKTGAQSSRRDGKAERDVERSAIHRMSSAKACHSYRETVAAKIPVTYVSKGSIIRVAGGKTTIIGRSVPSVKVISTKR